MGWGVGGGVRACVRVRVSECVRFAREREHAARRVLPRLSNIRFSVWSAVKAPYSSVYVPEDPGVERAACGINAHV